MLTQPLELVTGLPGASKTLHTIFHVEKVRRESGRQVFYSGIADLALPWVQMDPEKWFDCPPGSILVIDEAQRVFRPSSVAKEPPKFITELETIRHHGFNMVMVTQQPMLVHSNIRRLCGKHYHIVRSMGSHNAVMHEFDSVHENCLKPSGRAGGIKHILRFPKEVFGWYKSAEIHTVKRAIPMRLKLFLLLLLVIPLVGWYLWHRINTPPGAKPATPGQDVSGAVVASSTPTRSKVLMSYAEERRPRLQGLPFTAPIYDDVVKPTIAPKPVACVASRARCGCYTQQGTKIADMPEFTCRSLVENGFFDDAPDKRRELDEGRAFFDRQERSGQVLQARSEPSRVGADQVSDQASPSPRRAWQEPRQVVTPPPGKK